MTHRRRKEEAGAEEGGEVSVEVMAVTRKEGEIPNPQTRSPVPLPQLLVPTDP